MSKFSSDGQAAVEYAIVFVVFTLVAILLWTMFIESSQPGQPTPVVEKYVDRVKDKIAVQLGIKLESEIRYVNSNGKISFLHEALNEFF